MVTPYRGLIGWRIKMRWGWACCAGLVGLLAYSAFIAIKVWQPFKEIRLHQDETCVYLNTPEGQMEDITFTSEGVGIASIDDKRTLNSNAPLNTPQGGFVKITLEPFAYSPIPILGFPSDISLHPHGVFLFQEKWLYAVNYAYSRGGMRVEVFELAKLPEITLKHHRSILFADEYMGVLNDLIVLQDGELYVSYYLPGPTGKEGGYADLPSQLLIFFKNTYMKPTHLLRCAVDTPQAVCTSQVQGQQMNGVTTDGVDVFANDLHARQVIRLKRELSGELTELERIDTDTPIDNVEYHRPSGRIYGGGMSSLASFIQFMYFSAPKGPGTVVEIKMEGGTWVASDIITLDGMNSVSAAPRWDDYVVVGTWHDTKIARCKVGG
jgi:hypothetical protein